MLRVFPTRPMGLHVGVGALGENLRLGPFACGLPTPTVPFLDRVETLRNQLALRLRQLPRLSEPERVERAQAHLAGQWLAVPAEVAIQPIAEQPRLVGDALPGRDLQVQSGAIEIHAGPLFARDLQRGQGHVFLPPGFGPALIRLPFFALVRICSKDPEPNSAPTSVPTSDRQTIANEGGTRQYRLRPVW